MSTTTQTHDFKADVKPLLDLMINSLYSNKEIVLRELISNASDAIDKLRFAALSQPENYKLTQDLQIKVTFDKELRTLTVSDNGIGMSVDDMHDHLGTIAKSGTRHFLEQLTGDQVKDAQMIGQFGVGFYSSFIIADKVTVLSRRADLNADEGARWESSADGQYTISTIEKVTVGTDIILHLKEGEDEFSR